MSELKLTLLGSPHATVGEKSVIVESRKALALLYYLAVTHQRHSRDRLATLFWPEQDQARARASLRQVLWLLRNAGLEPWLVIDQDGLELQVGYWCDVHAFQHEIAAGNLTQALTLYRDDLLTGFSLRDCPEFDQWQFLQADELRRQLADVLAEWVKRCTEQGEYERGLEYARRWLTLDTLHEPIHRQLMQLYAYAGQHAAALRQYEECVRILEEELGVSPEEATTALYNAIKTRQISPPSTTPNPTKTLSAIADGERPVATELHAVATPATPPPLFHNLPTQLTPFVGRETEIDKLASVITDPDCRLVTVIGPGGIGKTRLAVQVARHFTSSQSLISLFSQGILFVALNAVESTNGMITAIAEATGIVFRSNLPARQQLLEYLHDRKMLLLLDNFEHLLSGADLVADILTTAPDITIMVTSREALNLQGEWQWVVSGLPFPEHAVAQEKLLDYSAVRMFVQSARRVQPNFSLAAEYENVVQVCRLVGGMPLAIELAAAWLRVVPCAQIVREIERDLNFLTTRLRDMPDRHRSIQAVFEHSWRLLSHSEQETFRQLSVFRGGFHRKAAEQVAGASWLDLAALVEKSLLSVDATGRYYIHELLRQYGASKLEVDPVEKQTTLERHCAYFAGFLADRLRAINGEGARQAAIEIETDLDNVRSALQCALYQRRLDLISQSITTFYFFCQVQSRFLEGAKALEDAHHCVEMLEPSRERDVTLASILSHQGWLYIRLGEFDNATAALNQSQEFHNQLNLPPQGVMGGNPTVPLAIISLIQGDYSHALELSEEALHEAEMNDDKINLAFAHYSLTSIKLALGDYKAARLHGKQACELASSTGTLWFLAYTLNESGKVARALGNLAEAERFFSDSYAIKTEFEDPEGMAVALNHLGEVACQQQNYDKSQRLHEEALTLYQGVNDRGGHAASLRGLGLIACARRDYPTAKQQFAQALTIATEIRFWPLTFSILLDVSRLMMMTGEHAFAIEIVTFVQRQPTRDHETKARADQQYNAWRQELAPELVDEAVKRGATQDVQTIVPLILAALVPSQG